MFFAVVKISLISWTAEAMATEGSTGNMGAFRALRTLRALRPLRAVSRWEGMKVSTFFGKPFQTKSDCSQEWTSLTTDVYIFI